MPIQQMLLGAGGAAEDRGTEDIITAGHTDYTWVNDTTTWVCPAGVTSISIVCIGAGARLGGNGSSHGGGGGGLGWKNNITVSPGTSYSVQVGEAWNNNSHIDNVNPNDTWFKNASGTIIVKGGAGSGQTGGSYTGDGGGTGGAGGTTYASWGNVSRGAGGGCAGYGYIDGNGTLQPGNGGAGADGAQSGTTGNQGSNGLNNAASGGNTMGNSNSHSACNMSGGGGGSHLYGTGGTLAGMKGATNSNTTPHTGTGRQGTNGQDGDIGTTSNFDANRDTNMNTTGNTGYPTGNNAFGGGHGTPASTTCTAAGESKGGAIRIIWPGNTRTFPDNALQTT